MRTLLKTHRHTQKRKHQHLNTCLMTIMERGTSIQEQIQEHNSGVGRGQTCPRKDKREEIQSLLISIATHGCRARLFPVTASMCPNWVNSAHIPFFRSVARFSDFPSRNELEVSVSRHCNGGPTKGNRKLTGQKCEGRV